MERRWWIKLTPQEVGEALDKARRRTVGTGGTRPVRHPSGDQNHIDRLGACGERAVLKALDLPLAAWSGHGNLGAPDIAPNLEVRSTDLGMDRRLLIRETDDADRLAILALDAHRYPHSPMNLWRIAGFIPIAEAKRREWRQSSGIYLVPQSALRPMEDLVDGLFKGER